MLLLRFFLFDTQTITAIASSSSIVLMYVYNNITAYSTTDTKQWYCTSEYTAEQSGRPTNLNVYREHPTQKNKIIRNAPSNLCPPHKRKLFYVVSHKRN